MSGIADDQYPASNPRGGTYESRANCRVFALLLRRGNAPRPSYDREILRFRPQRSYDRFCGYSIRRAGCPRSEVSDRGETVAKAHRQRVQRRGPVKVMTKVAAAYLGAPVIELDSAGVSRRLGHWSPLRHRWLSTPDLVRLPVHVRVARPGCDVPLDCQWRSNATVGPLNRKQLLLDLQRQGHRREIRFAWREGGVMLPSARLPVAPPSAESHVAYGAGPNVLHTNHYLSVREDLRVVVKALHFHDHDRVL
jgi:hypothetical protein